MSPRSKLAPRKRGDLGETTGHASNSEAAASPAPSSGAQATRRRNGRTSTTNFGSGKRESHDSSGFYSRFVAPEISADELINKPSSVDEIHCGDARSMDPVASSSVALVVTSPPYFAGKQYEEELGVGGIPADYFEYLQLLTDVFAECKRVLEPGGRIAVNVANLGRRPYRSLSADVTGILQDLGLLIRGEIIWSKGRAAGGSCAWGTFQSPANPVLRDVTERVVIASKGRFDRALSSTRRQALGLPSVATITRDEFMEATTDFWELSPESATRIGHPAPFPVSLPERLIGLYTYSGDLVLDPFMGSGSTAVAAVRTGRHFTGFDTDPAYVEMANKRIIEERSTRHDYLTPSLPITTHDVGPTKGDSGNPVTPGASGGPGEASPHDAVTLARQEGRQIKDLVEAVLVAAGFIDVRRSFKPRGLGIEVTFVAKDAAGTQWAFDVSGALSVADSGLRKADALWKALGKAAVLHEHQRSSAKKTTSHPEQSTPTTKRAEKQAEPRLVLLTTSAPARGTAGHRALAQMLGPDRPIFDVIELGDSSGLQRLQLIAEAGIGQAVLAQ